MTLFQNFACKHTPYPLDLKETKLTAVLEAAAPLHGSPINCTELGAALGISYHTAKKRMKILESRGILRRLDPFDEDHRKKSPKSPKWYFRDTSLLLRCLGLENEPQLLGSPMRHKVLAGYCIERVIRLESLHDPDTRFFYCGGYAGANIDLLMKKPDFAIGLIFRWHTVYRPRQWAVLKAAAKRGSIQRGFVVCGGDRSFFGCRNVLIIPALQFIEYHPALSDAGTKNYMLLRIMQHQNLASIVLDQKGWIWD